MTPAQLRQQHLHVPGIAVAERDHGSAGEPRAGPQAGMGQLVDEDEIVGADQRRDDAEIGEVAGAEHASGLGVLPARQPRFQRGEQGMVAGHKAGGAGADAIDAQRLDRRVLDRRMMGQVEIVVAAERQQPAAVAQRPDSGHTGGVDERTA